MDWSGGILQKSLKIGINYAGLLAAAKRYIFTPYVNINGDVE
ncbi:MAG: hypothetical protein PHE07_08400 [Bacteroidales bacterium]|jgi:hypothetical protein|nr:hypothetical protein [Bacteroidales bacterium]HOI21645.1 hypothetical protein [Spirochaetales bacterium]